MAKSKPNKHKGKRPQQRPQPAKPQSAKQQNEEILPVSGNRQARRAQERDHSRSQNGRSLIIRILIIVMLLVMLLGFFIAPLLGSR
jgi:hypothetical protein